MKIGLVLGEKWVFFYIKEVFQKGKVEYNLCGYMIMEPFLGDILLGGYLIISFIALIIGILVLRYRREMAPCLLISAGILGMFSSIFWVLIRSRILELPEIIPLIIMTLSLVALILSIIFWRGKN